ncbi:MAG: sigma-70 family RNA polymerase sigma factor [Candidatus Sungbacteria bacterium]|nr:sigma-70 family RNA polymerase sigma factor [Candidatus Sungbacteria bacterium]
MNQSPSPEHKSVDPEQMRDEEILKASLNEPALFGVLMDRFQEPLLRAALRVVRSREEAEDIVQEAFIKIYKHADAFQKLEGIEFKSWAYKITVNTAITHYRKLKRGEFLTDDPAIFEKADHEQPDVKVLAASDAKAAIAKTLAQMPEHLRLVMEAYYFQDKSYQTIAHEQQISIPTLKMRLFRAKRVFKKLTDYQL